ncbi:uncharacterized protein BJ171DRAFT_500970 [Polychytrium aggregatum]|uniref:uncharacterized protein n=1 Tax=Polychytrium aggregatum TaxID=110093 RepID=UPI0022FE4D75|nr:uncharacterized protein BJ171DRAFT_500970 [Polychytrium aggregatum]KAI9205621.1 hypothetical protein BJ171DRAFT_500970 [Polychytrium aggregatum]
MPSAPAASSETAPAASKAAPLRGFYGIDDISVPWTLLAVSIAVIFTAAMCQWITRVMFAVAEEKAKAPLYLRSTSQILYIFALYNLYKAALHLFGSLSTKKTQALEIVDRLKASGVLVKPGCQILDVGTGRGLLACALAREFQQLDQEPGSDPASELDVNVKGKRRQAGEAQSTEAPSIRRVVGIDTWDTKDLSHQGGEKAVFRNALKEGIADPSRFISIQTQDGRNTDFESGQFDAVVSSLTVHCFSEKYVGPGSSQGGASSESAAEARLQRDYGLQEMVRVARPGGTIMVWDIAHCDEYEEYLANHKDIDSCQSQEAGTLFGTTAHLIIATKKAK